MIAQNSTHMRPNISSFGCYYFSLVWWAWYLARLETDVQFLDEALYHKLIREHWMQETCYILDPVAILKYLRLSVTEVRKEPAEYTPSEDEILIGQFKADGDISHFVPVDHDKKVLFDPWQSKEGGSRAVREGDLISLRVFKRRIV